MGIQKKILKNLSLSFLKWFLHQCCQKSVCDFDRGFELLIVILRVLHQCCQKQMLATVIGALFTLVSLGKTNWIVTVLVA